MTKSSTLRRRYPSKPDANSRLPQGIENWFLQEIRKLPENPKVNYLKEQLLSKYVSEETLPAALRRNNAILKWLSVERDNKGINDRLITTHEDFNILPRVKWSRFISHCQYLVRGLIGETVPIEALIGSFSGGASTSRGRTESNPASKYLGKADTTPAARPWFELLQTEVPGWTSFSDQLSINEVRGNVLFTVLKNTTIDRCACKEPDLNMFMQKGVGNYFRRCLRNVGINLNDQSRNRYLARLGSLNGELATLDLSSASDRLSYGLVELMLPSLWFDLLRDLRSPITIIDGEEHVNEMFSSMGNGFTFELESLLFYVIARACAYFEGVSGVISVYGDDIIVPTRLANALTFVLEYVGFEINISKSYSSGPFRESCGGHYYNGYDITPFYLRKPMKLLTDLIRVANQLRRWSEIGDAFGILNPLTYPIWKRLRDLVPRSLWGGHDYGRDTQLVTPDLPRRQLVAEAKDKDTGAGGYIHWLNATWVRDGLPDEAVVTSSSSRASTRYRSRPVIHDGRLFDLPLFVEEVSAEYGEPRGTSIRLSKLALFLKEDQSAA